MTKIAKIKNPTTNKMKKLIIWNRMKEIVSCVIQQILLTPKSESPNQRHSLFKTRCMVIGKICNVIIDSGSLENVVSKKLVNALNLKLEPHPNPYKVSWIKKGGEAQVTHTCTVQLSIGNKL